MFTTFTRKKSFQTLHTHEVPVTIQQEPKIKQNKVRYLNEKVNVGRKYIFGDLNIFLVDF